MNRKVLKEIWHPEKYNVQKEELIWAQRTTFVVDKKGVIQSVEEERVAINPNNAVAVCTKLLRNSVSLTGESLRRRTIPGSFSA